MKVKTGKLKNLPKWVKVAVPAGVGAVALIAVISVACSHKSGSTFYKDLNSFVASENCNFRYVLNVQAVKSEGKTSSINLDDILSSIDSTEYEQGTEEGSETGTASSEDEKPKRSQTGELYAERINTSWSTQDGSSYVDWSYPNYELVVTGRTEQTDSLHSAFNIKLKTELISADLTNVVFYDGYCYIDMQTLRNWLLNSGDKNLIGLANEIPDGTTYLQLDEFEELRLSSHLLEEGEEGTSITGGVNMYRSFVALEKMLVSEIQSRLGNKGHTSEETKCRLSIDGDLSSEFIKIIRALYSNSGNIFEKWVANLKESNIVSDTTQLLAEKDNFIYSISNSWGSLASMTDKDIEDMNFRMLGKSSRYETLEGGNAIEINLGASYTYNGIDYIVGLTGCKQSTSVSSDIVVAVPNETVVTLSDSHMSMDNIQNVIDKLGASLSLISDNTNYSLNYSDMSLLKRSVLDTFIDIVNQRNSEIDGGVMTQNHYTISEYIGHYGNMTSEDASANETSRVNYECVQEFKELLGSLIADKNTEEVSADGLSWCGFMKKSGKSQVAYDITTDTEQTNSKMVVINVDVYNATGDILPIDFSKWYLTDKIGNKYPCNHGISLKGMDSNFDTSKLQTAVEVAPIQMGGVFKDMTDSDIRSNKPTRYLLYVVLDKDVSLTLHSESEELGIIRK